MNASEFGIMNEPSMDKAKSYPQGPRDGMSQPQMDKAKSHPAGSREANVTPDRPAGFSDTTLSNFYNLNQVETSELAMKHQNSGLSSKLQYTESDGLSRDTRGPNTTNPF